MGGEVGVKGRQKAGEKTLISFYSLICFDLEANQEKKSPQKSTQKIQGET